jgi:N-acetylglucosaminyl-diphospho-decaprenol L-rhamnosyltransferase
MDQVLLSIIIPTYKRTDLLDTCIQSILATQGELKLEIIAVNDGSEQEPFTQLQKKYSQIQILHLLTNQGIGKANNEGAQAAQGEILFFLNCDTQLCPGTLQEIVFLFGKNPKLGCLGCHELSSTGETMTTWRGRHTLRSAISGMTGFRIFKREGKRHRIPEWDRKSDRWMNNLHDFAWAVRRQIYQGIGGYDEIMRFYHGDCEIAMRLEKAGHPILYCAKARVIHHVGAYSKSISKSKVIYLWIKYFIYFRKKHHLSKSTFLDMVILCPFAFIWWVRRVLYALRMQRK